MYVPMSVIEFDPRLMLPAVTDKNGYVSMI